MASKAAVEEKRNSVRILSVLSSAVSEWLLMVLLFCNGFFTWFVTKFANYCKLQSPCPFCSRLDHVLGSEKPDSYKALICDAHKLEISSLAYCHIHHKLADVCEMCESCLLSFATEKKTNSETYRSLVGKLEMNIDSEERVLTKFSEGGNSTSTSDRFQDEQSPLLKKKQTICLLRKRYCSCCNEPFRMKSHARRLLQTKSVAADTLEPISPVLGLIGHHGSPQPQVGSSKKKEACCNGTMISQEENSGFDKFTYAYTKLKIASDSESDVPVLDNDNGHIHSHNIKEPSFPQYPQHSAPKSDIVFIPVDQSDESAVEKLIHPTPTPEPLISVPQKQILVHEPSEASSLASSSALAHGLNELNWGEVGVSTTSVQSDVLLDKDPSEVTNLKLDAKIISSDKMANTQVSTEGSQMLRQMTNDYVMSVPDLMSISDAYRLVISNKGAVPSPREPSRAQEELRRLLSQLSAAQGLELSMSDMTSSPRVQDGPGPSVLQSFTKAVSLERNESGFESSLDGSVLSDIEGESAIDRLKRQLELERKALSLLCKELEEEKSASTIAANQAMAMITRLQEEKAAMQMEALQYQRMMEEQVEYDEETLQKTDDLLVEKEGEIENLKAELEIYRKQFNDDLLDGEIKRLRDGRERTAYGSLVATPRDRRSVRRSYSLRIDKSVMQSDDRQAAVLQDPSIEFEQEKAHIFECLKKLESKLHVVAGTGIHGTSGHDVSSTEDHLDEALEDNHISDNNTPKQDSSAIVRGTDAAALATEVSRLRERLETLEADRSFLEHTIYSLRNGNEGLRFVQEIACHLQELRYLGVQR